MNFTPDNNQFLSEMVPPLTPQEQPSVKSAKAPWYKKWLSKMQALWLRIRFGGKPKLAKPSMPTMPKSVRRYWWVAIPVVLVLAAGAVWWVIDYNNKQDWQQATDYYRRADYAKAAPLLLNKPLPESTDQLRIYGQTMQATNHPDQALEAYQKLYQKDRDPFAKLVIGNIHNQQQQYDEAIKAYQELLDANPSYIQAYVNLATVYRLQGKNSQAIEVAEQALQNNPNNVVLAELAVSLSAENPTSSHYRQAVERLKKLNPDDPLLKQLDSD